jgi:outer membrane protein OmpA-like peptidoglycan-associated protein
MDFATQEEKEYDWFNSWHFADKGLMLAYGKDAGPEELSDWSIPDEMLPELEKARMLLMSVLTPNQMRSSPSRAAEAQFYFDCWVEQAEEQWQQDDIAFCRDNLMRTLEGLDAGVAKSTKKSSSKSGKTSKAAANPAADTAKKAEEKVFDPAEAKTAAPKTAPVDSKSTAKPDSKPTAASESKPAVAADAKAAVDPKAPAPAESKSVAAAEPSKAPVEAHAETISYAVFFEADKAQLSEPGQNVIGEIVDSLKNIPNYEIIIHVAAGKDAAGALSQERSKVVQKRLVGSGIPEHAIKNSSESAPATSGRRVEIFLNE